MNNIPEAKVFDENKVSLESLVTVKFISNAAGYNAGEIARFKKSIAAKFIKDKTAVLHTEPTMSNLNIAVAVKRTIDLVRVAKDEEKSFNKQHARFTEATQAVGDAAERAEQAADDEIENAKNARHLYEENLKTDEDLEIAEAEKAHNALKAATKSLVSAQKAIKKAEDKDEANAVIASAEDALETAELYAKKLDVEFFPNQETRKANLAKAVEVEEATLDAVRANMAELRLVLDTE